MTRRSLLLLLPVLAGCGGEGNVAGWWDQPSPSGPCWAVDLADGLSTSSTDELHALYRCLNQDDAFAAFGGLDVTMDEHSRAGQPLGVELALMAQGLGQTEVDLFAIAGVALDLLEAEDRPIEPLMRSLVELMYGQPYAVVAADSFELTSESALASGVLVPVLPALSASAAVILDDGDAIPSLLGEALESSTLEDAVCTVVALADATDGTTASAVDGLLPHLGTAIGDARSPDNDRWSGSSGDSLRDVVEALVVNTAGDGQTALEAMSGDLEGVLLDAEVGARVHALVEDASDDGYLDELPLWALYLTEVDPLGEALCDGGSSSGCSDDDSALYALIRMLHDADTEVDCSVVGITVYEGNLAEDLLRLIAEQDPDTVLDLNDLLGTLLGWSVTTDLLDWLLGACDGIADTTQLVADLESLDRLNDPEAGRLLEVLIAALGAVYEPDGSLDHMSPVVDLIGTAHARGLIHPVEEVLRDLASTALISDVVDLVPALLEPANLNTDRCPTDSAPLDFDATWALLGDLLTAGDRAEAPIDTLSPVLIAALSHEGTWTAVGNFGALAREDDAEVAGLLDLIPGIVAADPELDLVAELAPILTTAAVYEPALRLVESDALIEAACETELSAEGPLPFAARQVIGGTMDEALRTVDLLLGELGG